MSGSNETTNTNVKIPTKTMKEFKNVIDKQGYKLRKGIEIALSEYIKKHKERSQ